MLLTLTLAMMAVPQDAAAADKPKKERKICRAVVETGSRMSPPRECRTRAEWNRIDGDPDPNFRGMDTMNTRGHVNGFEPARTLARPNG